jgi:hypothetical protein
MSHKIVSKSRGFESMVVVYAGEASSALLVWVLLGQDV